MGTNERLLMPILLWMAFVRKAERHRVVRQTRTEVFNHRAQIAKSTYLREDISGESSPALSGKIGQQSDTRVFPNVRSLRAQCLSE